MRLGRCCIVVRGRPFTSAVDSSEKPLLGHHPQYPEFMWSPRIRTRRTTTYRLPLTAGAAARTNGGAMQRTCLPWHREPLIEHWWRPNWVTAGTLVFLRNSSLVLSNSEIW